MFFFILYAPLAIFGFFRIINWIRNYIAAREYGLRIILLPVAFDDIWWMPLRSLFAWVEHLPFGLGNWWKYTEMGWPTTDGNRTVLSHGENFVLCSPASNVIATCYPPGIEQIFREHKNWTQPPAQSQLFAFYGQNVSSTNGPEWQRHRKITGSAFNEHSMAQVWHETIKRTKMLDLMEESNRSLGRIRSTFEVLAMHVLAIVGFGQEAELSSKPPGHRQTLMQSLGFILKNILLTLVFNGLKAPDFLLPDRLKQLKVSVAEFRLYMEEQVLRHLQASQAPSSSSRPSSLLGAMVKANEAEKQLQEKNANGKRSFLTDSELYGNLFVFNLAGFETTASSMTFALSYLAAYPEAQDWITEEVDARYSHAKDANYADIYPKLVRCSAFMYETLRLASPAPLLVRTPTAPAEIPIITAHGQRTVVVKPGTLVGAHFYGAHLSPRWGKDALAFNPRRFVKTSSTGEESLEVPEEAVYMPWIMGPRVCPGKKFSQVEFVAVFAEMLSTYRVDVLARSGESEMAAKARLLRVVDEKYFNVSAHLNRPEDAGVRFTRRHGKH